MSSGTSDTFRRDRLFVTALIFLLAFITIELSLQWRAHLRWGQSIFDAASKGETRNFRCPKTGLVFLRPNREFSSQRQVVRSNSLGLRSPEPIVPKPFEGIRVAVIGASSVFGAYAATNELTFSQLLAKRLNDNHPESSVEVVNAGLVGLALEEQLIMLEKVVLPLKPDLVILYPGANDFVRFCRKQKKKKASWQPLWQPNVASVLLTSELISKNTMALREQFAPLSQQVDTAHVDLSFVEEILLGFVNTANKEGVKVLLVTNARSYRPEQPIGVQKELAGTALYYNYCFSMDDLHNMHHRFNEVISRVAASTGTAVVPLDRLLPGGTKYFADANHFSAEGEQAVADILLKYVLPVLPSREKAVRRAGQ